MIYLKQLKGLNIFIWENQQRSLLLTELNGLLIRD